MGFFDFLTGDGSEDSKPAAPDLAASRGYIQGGLDRSYGAADRLENFGGQAYGAAQPGTQDYSRMAMESARRLFGDSDVLRGYADRANQTFEQYGRPAYERLARGPAGYEGDPYALASAEQGAGAALAQQRGQEGANARAYGRMGLNPDRIAAAMAQNAQGNAAQGVGAWNQGYRGGIDRQMAADQTAYQLGLTQQGQAGAFMGQAGNSMGAGVNMAGQGANAWLPGASFRAGTYKPEVGQYGVQAGLGYGGLQNQQYGTQAGIYNAEQAKPSTFGAILGAAAPIIGGIAGGPMGYGIGQSLGLNVSGYKGKG